MGSATFIAEAARFRNACMILMNIDLDELEKAGVITPGATGSSWERFNRDPLMFIAKLPDDRYAALYALIEARQPKREAA